jgi:hypothetical protein
MAKDAKDKEKGRRIKHMETMRTDAHDALDRLLALRPEDCEPGDDARAAGLPAGERAAAEAQDRALGLLLDAWATHDEASLRAPAGWRPDWLSELEAQRAERRVAPRVPARLASGFALAAALVLGFALWTQEQSTSSPSAASSREGLGGGGLKSLPSAESATRVEVQLAIERGLGSAPSSLQVLPAARDAAYGPGDRLVLRLDVRGEGGFGWIVELADDAPEAAAVLIWPPAGSVAPLRAGLHGPTGSDGRPLSWEPERGGRLRYLGFLTSEPVDPVPVARAVAAAGVGRPDAWPRPVRAADVFAITWDTVRDNGPRDNSSE